MRRLPPAVATAAVSLVALAVAAVVPVAARAGDDGGAGLGAQVSGPQVDSSRSVVEPGQATVLTISGFSSPWVQISVCGNEARRGSADCAMSETEGIEVRDGARVLSMPMAAPPVHCPCVVRVVGQDVTEVALTPIEIVGHPVGELIDPPVFGELVAVAVVAREAPLGSLGALRSDLAGRIRYEVTVRVRNVTTTPLRQVRASLVAGGRDGGDDELVSVDLDNPGLIGVGQTWQQTVAVELPAPALGSTSWRAVVSGAGPTVVATGRSEHRPWLLVVLVMVVVSNMAILFVRWRVRRRAAAGARRAAAAVDAPGAIETTESREVVSAGARTRRPA